MNTSGYSGYSGEIQDKQYWYDQAMTYKKERNQLFVLFLLVTILDVIQFFAELFK